jgi:hypothetical protein
VEGGYSTKVELAVGTTELFVVDGGEVLADSHVFGSFANDNGAALARLRGQGESLEDGEDDNNRDILIRKAYQDMGNGWRASSATWRRMSIPRPYSSSLSAIPPG